MALHLTMCRKLYQSRPWPEAWLAHYFINRLFNFASQQTKFYVLVVHNLKSLNLINVWMWHLRHLRHCRHINVLSYACDMLILIQNAVFHSIRSHWTSMSQILCWLCKFSDFFRLLCRRFFSWRCIWNFFTIKNKNNHRIRLRRNTFEMENCKNIRLD